jgi:hypothetical protein
MHMLVYVYACMDGMWIRAKLVGNVPMAWEISIYVCTCVCMYACGSG